MLSLLCAGGQHPVYIAGEHINLDIELSADGDFAERRHLSRVRNDVDRETVAADFVDRQRHAIERDRAFGRDASGQAIGSARSRFSFAPSRHRLAAVFDTVSAEASTANQSGPLSTTVRQVPEQAIEAPMATVDKS